MVKPEDKTNPPKRQRLQLLAGFCAIGAGAYVAKRFVDQPQSPSGYPTLVDCSDLVTGKLSTVDWHGRTVMILRRSAEEVAALTNRESELLDPHSEHSLQPEGCRNRHRSLRPDIFVAVGQCTHQGCPPQLRAAAGTHGEFLCPCHSSKYDLAGRVFRSGPAASNLIIPNYRLDGATRLIIGES